MPDERLGAHVLGFGEDDNGELYVMTSMSGAPTDDTGKVWKLVPAEGGAESTAEATSGAEATTEANTGSAPVATTAPQATTAPASGSNEPATTPESSG